MGERGCLHSTHWVLPANDALTHRDDQQRTGMNIVGPDGYLENVHLRGHVICRCVGLACVVLVGFLFIFSNTDEHQPTIRLRSA
jgi:hypothetical protein